MNITITDIEYPFDDHVGFRIFLKSGNGPYNNVHSIPKSDTSATLTGLNAGVQQCIQLAAYNSFGDGPLSDEVCVGNPAPITIPMGKPVFKVVITG